MDWYEYVIMIVTAALVYLFIKFCTDQLTKPKKKQPPQKPKGKEETESEVEEEIITETVVVGNTAELTRDAGNTLLELLDADNLENIVEKVETIDDVTDLLRKAGLNAVNLIFGIDYTASNYRQGKNTFGGKGLHDVGGPELNPYQKVIGTLGQTLEPLSETGIIPAFGFGDSSTRDVSIFPISDKSQSDCRGFQEVLHRYNKVTPTLRLSGPTNFAPLIKEAVSIVKKTKKYHILVIVADGQVTREIATREAIIEASRYALSIIMIGVGDGPWDGMDEYDDQLPERQFDNFHFVDYHKTHSAYENSDAAFAIQAFIEIPDQYKSIRKLGYLEKPDSKAQKREI